jgi:hypothetical protein
VTATASHAFDRLLDALRDQSSHVIDNGHGKARARCPAHDDHNPSLSITGIDLSTLPAIATARELAPVMGTTEAALAQDRYRRGGIPYVKFRRRVRYLRADVARYLVANRSNNPPGVA